MKQEVLHEHEEGTLKIALKSCVLMSNAAASVALPAVRPGAVEAAQIALCGPVTWM